MMPLSAPQQWKLVSQLRAEVVVESSAAERAMNKLMADFRAPAWAVIYRTLRAGGVGIEHTEEAWQQTCFKFFAVGLAKLSGDAPPRSYFLKIALNVATDLVRARRHLPLDKHEATSSDDPLTALVNRHELRAQIAALRQCLEQLGGANIEAAKRYYLDQIGSCQRCAEALGISRAALMKRLERARTALGHCIEGKLAAQGKQQ